MKKYKLIKKYPGLPLDWKIGMEIGIGDYCKDYYSPLSSNYTDFRIKISSVENYPEFWKKVKEETWRVMSYKPSKLNSFVNKVGIADVSNKTSSVAALGITNQYWDINSIKRLSDNVVFTIGDRIKMIGHVVKEAPEVITKIELNKADVPCLFTNTFNNNGINFERAIKHEKLFTTEDGVDVFEGDSFVYVDQYYDVTKIKCAGETSGTNGFKYFSTEKAAKDWINLNRPRYSLQDIQNAKLNYIIPEVGAIAIDFEQLENKK